MKKIHQGFTSEGLEIWRWQTAEEQLFEELERNKQESKLSNFRDFEDDPRAIANEIKQ